MAVRAALGASRARLIRQALAESTLLGLAGGAVGSALAFALLGVFRSMGSSALPRLEEASIDLRVLAFTVAAAIASGIAAGLPAAWRPPGVDGLRGTRSTSPARGWLRGGLVAAQIAVSLTLLAGAGLLLRSLWNLERVPLGVEGGHVVTASFSLGRQRYVEADRQLAFFTDLERRLKSVPGAEAVALADSLPPTGGTRARPFSTIAVEGQQPAPAGSGGMVVWRYITPGYFQALGIPIRRGRSFSEGDRTAGVFSMVVSETLARRWFGNENPIGRRVLRDPGSDWFTIVGVASDVNNSGVDRTDPEYYVVRKPIADVTWRNQEPPMGWRKAFAVVRTPVDPGLAAAELRRIAAEIDPTLPIEIATMRARLETVTERPRFYATLLGAFAAIGVLLAATGLFGTMSFLVTQRRREIGIRMALGASAGSVLRHVLAFAARWAVVGVALGVPGAILVARWLRGLLFHVSPGDPGALAVSALLLAAVVLTAAIGPAWRAARVDPADTLRED
jgi:predicted permease